MKKKHLILALILCTCLTTYAQKNRERIKMVKISFISNALDFTPKEAQLFWPVYNLHSDKIAKLKFSLGKGSHRTIKSIGNIDSISDKKAQEVLNKMLLLEENVLAERKAMFKALLKILPAKKVLKLQKVERNFNKKMLLEFGKRRRMKGTF